MPMPPEIKALLPGTIVLERYLGEDQWGNDHYEAAEPDEPAFVESSAQTFGRTEEGAQHTRVVTTYRIITDAIGIKPGDRITLAGGIRILVDQVDSPALDVGGVPVMQTSTAVLERLVS